MFHPPLKTEASMAPHTFCDKVAFLNFSFIMEYSLLTSCDGFRWTAKDSDIHI